MASHCNNNSDCKCDHCSFRKVSSYFIQTQDEDSSSFNKKCMYLSKRQLCGALSYSYKNFILLLKKQSFVEQVICRKIIEVLFDRKSEMGDGVFVELNDLIKDITDLLDTSEQCKIDIIPLDSDSD